MDVEASIIHVVCNGTGFKSLEDGSIDVCVECMGSGVIGIDIEMGDHPNWIKEK